MWTIVRFGLRSDGDYRAAFDLLAHAGLQPHRSPDAAGAEPFPAAVVADLHDAGLGPVAVCAAHVDVSRRLTSPRPPLHEVERRGSSATRLLS
jgi:hypothetical protein